jgi:hypothetical protein
MSDNPKKLLEELDALVIRSQKAAEVSDAPGQPAKADPLAIRSRAAALAAGAEWPAKPDRLIFLGAALYNVGVGRYVLAS